MLPLSLVIFKKAILLSQYSWQIVKSELPHKRATSGTHDGQHIYKPHEFGLYSVMCNTVLHGDCILLKCIRPQLWFKR